MEYTQQEKGLKTEEAQALKAVYGKRKNRPEIDVLLAALMRQIPGLTTVILLLVSIFLKSWGDDIGSTILLIAVLAHIAFAAILVSMRHRRIAHLSHGLQAEFPAKRDGVFKDVAAEDIVIGDVLQLLPGMFLPADVRIIYTNGLSAEDLAMLEGKISFVRTVKKGALLRKGTMIVQGMGEGKVTAALPHGVAGSHLHVRLFEKHNSHTLGMIMLQLSVSIRATLLALAVLGAFIALRMYSAYSMNPSWIAFIIIISFTMLLDQQSKSGSAASVYAASSLAAKGIIPKSPAAIEALARTTVICSDIAGVLTENACSFVSSFTANDQALNDTLSIAQGLRESVNDPYLLAFSLSKPVPSKTLHLQHVAQNSADTGVLLCIVTASGEEVSLKQVTVETALPHMKGSHDQLDIWLKKQQTDGNRIFGYLLRKNGNTVVAGFAAYKDVFRPDIKKTVDRASCMGVTLKIFGNDDAQLTASAAREIECLGYAQQPVHGDQWDNYQDDMKADLVSSRQVFNRFSPQQTSEIVRLLQKKNMHVTVIGQTMNDGIPMQVADASIALARSPHALRRHADMVATEYGLSCLLDAIASARQSMHNMVSFMKISIATVLSVYVPLLLISLWYQFAAVSPEQIVMLHLLLSIAAFAVLSDTSAGDEAPQIVTLRALWPSAIVLGLVSVGIYFLSIPFVDRLDAASVRFSWLLLSVLVGMSVILLLRSRKRLYFSGLPSASIIISFLLICAFIVAAFILPVVGSYLGVRPPTADAILAIGLCALCFLIGADYAKKALYLVYPKAL